MSAAKISVAKKAIDYIKKKLSKDTILGVGTGSTINFFIRELDAIKHFFRGAVSSSEVTSKLLKELNIDVFSLNDVNQIDFYIDGADEVSPHNFLIKGGGGAHTREKIVASASNEFICIVDDSKHSDLLGKFPLPIEVLEIARSAISREIMKMGGKPIYRNGFITDNGNQIIDVHNLLIEVPFELEEKINNIPGVVENGIFSNRKADVIVKAKDKEVEILDQ